MKNSVFTVVLILVAGFVSAELSEEYETYFEGPAGFLLTKEEKKEWEGLPARIEGLERELEALHDEMAGPDFFRGDPDAIREATIRSRSLPQEIEAAFERWAQLDQRAGS